jgi:hypothetical protein
MPLTQKNDRIEEIMVGDRVWWREGVGDSWQRGVVREIDKNEGRILRYLVVHVNVDEAAFQVDVDVQDPETGEVYVPMQIKRDRYHGGVPRFSVGDRVVYRNPKGDQASTRGFSASIRKLWVRLFCEHTKALGHSAR